MKTIIEILTYWPALTAGFGAVLVLMPALARGENRIQR